jgi:predicted transcriptional regulator/transcriptional regulator with XRE-family HTH domain
MRTPKLFIGQKLRELRDEQQMTQAQFAEQLGISNSYLNQLENNQRHVTASVLLALAERFSVNIAELSRQDSDRLMSDLLECYADPIFDGKAPSSRELRLAAQNSPAVALSVITMHQALRRASDQLAEMDDTITRSGVIGEPTPYEEVRDYFHFKNNYVDELDTRAEALANQLAQQVTDNQYQPDRNHVLRQYLIEQHGVTVGEELDATNVLRSYSPDNRLLRVNRRTPHSTQAFQIAHQIALLEHRAVMDEIINEAQFRSAEASDICRIGFANYFAGAMLMPYARFQAAARLHRHDLVDLADRFDSSVEQVAHRLSTLQRPGLSGIPIFFARIDRAGNITKRHSATRLQFARFGSACPLWNAHRAFETPGQIIRQLAETPDGVRYLCLACTVDKPTGGYRDPTQQYALALGCEIKFKDDFVYSDTLAADSTEHFEPIGTSCRICEREHCVQRALPPLKRGLKIDPNYRRTIPYTLS